MILNMSGIPRANILNLPTPMTELKRLSEYLGGPRIFIKRDDLTGLAMGGNKTRKLEFLLGDALEKACDSVIICGASQSNCCRQTAAAAAALGLECHLALGGEQPEYPEGNLLLDVLYGAKIHWCGRYSKGETVPEIAAKLISEGRKPYIIPFGGSNSVGGLGFVAAICELKQQMEERSIDMDYLILPSSSGGTHAGMTVGVDTNKLSMKILGIGIDRNAPGEYEAELAVLAGQISSELGVDKEYRPDQFGMNYDYYGSGYAVVGDMEREAVRLMGRLEGILLDPVYTARATGALIDMIRRNKFNRADKVLIWHTGGMPTVFGYAKELA